MLAFDVSNLPLVCRSDVGILLKAMAYMSDEFTAAFASVEFKQGAV